MAYLNTSKPGKLELPPEVKRGEVCCICGKPVDDVLLSLASEGKPAKVYHVECLLNSLK
jgi:hypothetical protein